MPASNVNDYQKKTSHYCPDCNADLTTGEAIEFYADLSAELRGNINYDGSFLYATEVIDCETPTDTTYLHFRCSNCQVDLDIPLTTIYNQLGI